MASQKSKTASTTGAKKSPRTSSSPAAASVEPAAPAATAAGSEPDVAINAPVVAAASAPAVAAAGFAAASAAGGGVATAVRPAVSAVTAAPSRPAPPPVAGLDQTIARALNGQVNVTPAKAIAVAGELYSQGRLLAAEKVCRQIIGARPAMADGHNILGVTLNALGKPQEAVASLKRAIKLAPGAASFHANLGEIERQAGHANEAGQALREALRLEPTLAQAHNNLGIIAFDKQDFEDAITHYRAALDTRPDMAEAWNNLGNSLRMVGDRDGALDAYQDALTYRENYAEAYNNLGTLLNQMQQNDEAEHALKKAIGLSPQYVEAHNNLANVFASQKKELEALRILGDALKFAPRHPQTLLITARIQNNRGAHEAAEQAARIVLHDDPTHTEAKVVLGQVLHETDRYDAAVDVLAKAVAAEPDNAEARNFFGVALKSVGRLDEARAEILKAIEINDTMYGAYANLNDLVDFKEQSLLFDRMETIFESSPDLTADHLLPLHFAFGKALEDRGEYERALHHYIAGGRMKRALLDYDEADTHGFFDSIRAAFPKEIFEQRKFAGNGDDRPTFIVGMPRSGSTLVEQILSSHPDIYGAGEVKYLSRALGQLRDRFPSLPKFPQMAAKMNPAQYEMLGKNYLGQLVGSAGEARRVTDKLLTNYFFVGLIHLLFPNAKIIHTMRDPVDTCLSGFTKLFKDDMPHSYDLGELGRYYGKYRELMQHWEAVLPPGVLTTIVYEDTVAHTEREARRLIEFLGLEWNEACLEFHKSSRPVKTASVAQVRQPIYTSAVARWKKYGDGLQPLVDAIG